VFQLLYFQFMRFNRFFSTFFFSALDVNHSPRLEPVVVNARQCDHKQAFASNPLHQLSILYWRLPPQMHGTASIANSEAAIELFDYQAKTNPTLLSKPLIRRLTHC